MELKLIPSKKNNFSVGAFLIKSASTTVWLQEFQKIGLDIQSNEAYPIPDVQANSIWGCIAILNSNNSIGDLGKNMLCQTIQNTLYIPENCDVFPVLSKGDLQKLFKEKKHLLHPEFGMVELKEELDWSKVLSFPENLNLDSIEPADSVSIPSQINSFQIKALEPENALEELEKKAFPKQEKMKSTRLSLLEKVKLLGYKSLFSKSKKEGTVSEKPLLNAVQKIGRLFGKKNNWKNELQEDYEDLEERNQKELDKFLKLMEKNPDEALKYAIPLDQNGSARGDMTGSFSMSRRWNNFSLFSRDNFSGRSGGGVQMADSTFDQLNQQYHRTAELLIEQKNYEKAAFVYMKLLKNDFLGAQTFENGKMYQEAASIYLSKLKNSLKAAECYEKGKMTVKAIELYKELDRNEKVGDLYMSLNKKKAAFDFYKLEGKNRQENFQFLEAANLYKDKFDDLENAQMVLLKGWRQNKNASKCLTAFFDNTKDFKIKENQFMTIYKYEVNHENYTAYLKILRTEFEKKNEIQASVKDIAYQLISNRAPQNPRIIQELRKFNQDNKHISRDLTRFRLKTKK